MTDIVEVAFITAAPIFILGIANLLLGLYNHNKLQSIHVQINSRMDELLKMTAAHALSEGTAAGVEQEREKQEKIDEWRDAS